jgi:molecular chaperone Hsp33
MWDSLVRATADNNNIRVSAAITTRLVEEARQRHQTSPVASAALGRVLTGVLLLSWNLKDKGSITMRVLGDGPLGGVIADVNAQGQVRGYIQNPQVDLPPNKHGKLDVGGGIGQGNLYITTDLGLKDTYTGSVALETGEIGEDLAKYLVISEQTPSLVSVGVLVNPDLTIAAAGGIIVQALPNGSPEVLTKIEENLQNLKPISTLIKEGNSAQDIIKLYLKDIEVKFLEEKQINFNCPCNKERLEKIMISLGKDELEDIINNEGSSEVKCHFCNEHYYFTKEELEKLLVEASK